jgi:hypothetical protein
VKSNVSGGGVIGGLSLGDVVGVFWVVLGGWFLVVVNWWGCVWFIVVFVGFVR